MNATSTVGKMGSVWVRVRKRYKFHRDAIGYFGGAQSPFCKHYSECKCSRNEDMVPVRLLTYHPYQVVLKTDMKVKVVS